MSKKRILHIVISLVPGGTEKSLINLIKNTNKDFNHEIISLTKSDKFFSENVIKEGIVFRDLKIKGFLSLISAYFYLKKEYRNSNIELISGWLYHSNFASIIIKKLINSNAKIIWNIRSSLDSYESSPWHRKLVILISKRLINRVSGIIYNSKRSLDEHEEIGYKTARDVVINNGIDIEKFKKIEFSKEKLSTELGLKPSIPIIGMCARYHKVKNHALLIKAIKVVLDKGWEVNCILCGKGLNKKNRYINSLIEATEWEGNFYLLDHNEDMPKIYSSLDIHILTSFSESSPNAILEAMACETVCLSTNVGDNKYLFPKEFIINDNEPITLANRIIWLLEDGKNKRAELGKTSRSLIKSNFSMSKMSNSFTDLYKEVISSE